MTFEELESLPVHTVLLDDERWAWQKIFSTGGGRVWRSTDGLLDADDGRTSQELHDYYRPLHVIWQPFDGTTPM